MTVTAIIQNSNCFLTGAAVYLKYLTESELDTIESILEETEAEKIKYSEADAEKLLTNLIYRELKKVV